MACARGDAGRSAGESGGVEDHAFLGGGSGTTSGVGDSAGAAGITTAGATPAGWHAATRSSRWS